MPRKGNKGRRRRKEGRDVTEDAMETGKGHRDDSAGSGSGGVEAAEGIGGGGGGGGGSGAGGEDPGDGFTATQLADKAAQFVAKIQPELACKFYERALDVDPDRTDIMDTYASLLMDMGEADKAHALLQRSIELRPNGSATKWLYMAQLCGGEQAAEALERGIALLEKELPSTMGKQRRVVRRQISSAFCSITELYMTDLCDEDDAEERCNDSVAKAVEVDESNPEAHQAVAQLRIVQGRRREAAESAARAAGLLQDLADREEQLPPYLLRLALARMLVDLEVNEQAVAVLDGLLAEDDTEMEVWFLIGEAFRNNGDFDSANEYLEKAVGMVQDNLKEGVGDEEELAAQLEQLSKLLDVVNSEITTE